MKKCLSLVLLLTVAISYAQDLPFPDTIQVVPKKQDIPMLNLKSHTVTDGMLFSSVALGLYSIFNSSKSGIDLAYLLVGIGVSRKIFM